MFRLYKADAVLHTTINSARGHVAWCQKCIYFIYKVINCQHEQTLCGTILCQYSCYTSVYGHSTHKFLKAVGVGSGLICLALWRPPGSAHSCIYIFCVIGLRHPERDFSASRWIAAAGRGKCDFGDDYSGDLCSHYALILDKMGCFSLRQMNTFSSYIHFKKW